MVNYINYETEEIKGATDLNYIMHKRESFAHERELRAVIRAEVADPAVTKVGDSGLAVSLDVNALIERIYVSPTAAPPLREVVEALTADYKLQAAICQSEADAPPNYLLELNGHP